MKTHQSLAVQMAGTACLYHVCKQKRVRRIAPRQLFLVVERCLDAAEYFQNIVQVLNIHIRTCILVSSELIVRGVSVITVTVLCALYSACFLLECFNS